MRPWRPYAKRTGTPSYAFVRRRGHDPAEASDLTQAFFATLLEKGYLQAADQRRGRFRTFLMAACGHFLSKEQGRARALKARRRPCRYLARLRRR